MQKIKHCSYPTANWLAKIASSQGITSSGELPTTGTPPEQNQVLILQNQETFKAIAEKVGATVPALSKPGGSDVAEQNHNLLLQTVRLWWRSPAR
ncbi:MAG: hypothetical protein HC856_11520 [Pseudanabaena sp. RU_4_16]|nr:hypothetical protein [Pseudanabaena sp. RU_4_16]